MRRVLQVLSPFQTWPLIMLSMGLLAVLPGCASEEIPYPEAHARYQRGIQAIRTLETAYVKQDLDTIHELLLPNEPLKILEVAIQQDFSTFETIELNLTIDRILVDGDHLKAFISWQGIWHRPGNDAPTEGKGHGTLLWNGDQVILLRGIEGDIPFGMTSRLNFSS